MIEDRLLIWKFKRGSTEALCRIYEKYKNDMLKLSVALINDVTAAEDIVQDVFLSFARSAAKIKTHGNLKQYFSSCLVNRTRNYRRDQQRHKTTDIEEADCAICEIKRPEQWAILSEEMEMLNNALAQIPYEQREVVTLYMQADTTFRKIAKMQNASINTVQGRYRYGMNKLRSILNSEIDK
jgi:RNA polymerase sigma factor (sigma-70 family)